MNYLAQNILALWWRKDGENEWSPWIAGMQSGVESAEGLKPLGHGLEHSGINGGKELETAATG